MFEAIFKNRTANFKKLQDFGFKRIEDKYTYSINIIGEQFKFIVDIISAENIKTKVIDNDTNEAYILHLTTDAVGTFVGKIRTECESILQKIANECFEVDVFKSDYAHNIIRYLQEKYQNELEFLWKKFSDNAIVRRKDNKKWYAAVLVVSKRKLGIQSDELVEVIDLRGDPEFIKTSVDYKKYFPGYHMNKKYWFTICLDGSVSLEEIYNQLDKSYLLAKK